jgi:chromosome segregation ATPase
MPQLPAWRVLREAAKDAGNVSGGESKPGDAGKAVETAAEEKDPEDLGGLKSALAKTKEDRNKLRERTKAIEAELEEIRKAKAEQDAAEKAASEQRLVEEGKFKELSETQKAQIEKLTATATEAKSLAKRLEEAEAVIAKTVESRIKALNLSPAIATLLADKTPTQQLAWLDANGETLATGTGTGPHGMAPGGKSTSSTLSDDDRIKQASRSGLRLAL